MVYFAHALEILLHTVVEDEADGMGSSTGQPSNGGVLSKAVEFLDHFDVALDVVVGCARKTEMTRWKLLFDVVGNPEALFEVSSIIYLRKNLLIVDIEMSCAFKIENSRILPSCSA